MKKFYLSKCVPYQGNREINSVFCKSRQEAINYFNKYGHLFHEKVNLDSEGYQKMPDQTTYIVAEAHK